MTKLPKKFPRDPKLARPKPELLVCEVMPNKYHLRVVGPEGRNRPNQTTLCGKTTTSDCWMGMIAWGQTEIPGTWCSTCWELRGK